MTDPVPGVGYRIQNLDCQSYLELVDESMVESRPAKETDLQHWQFEHVPGSSSFYVRNVANSDHYLQWEDILPGVEDTSKSLINVSYQDGAYKLALCYNSTNFYLGVDGTTVFADNDDLEGQKWQLVPVPSQPINKDLLQSGTYRIRNFNGKSLLTMPDGQSGESTNVYARSQSGHSAYQRWTVTQHHSGRYTIQNVGGNSYLGTSPATAVVGDGLVGLQHVYLWDIRSVGGFAWSLRIPGAELSVGAVGYEVEDNVEMSLVLSDNTPSQIWFIEKYIPLEKIDAKREVAEGTYLVQHAYYSAYMNVLSAPWRITPGSDKTSKFELKYIDKNSAHFTLTYVTTSKPAPLVADVGGHLGLAGKASEFVLVEKDEGPFAGYAICRADPGRLHKVVTASPGVYIDGTAVIVMKDLVPRNVMQIWKLVSAP